MSAGQTGVPRAVLDANVIFSRVLHELFGRLARQARLLDLVWSEELLGEARRVLVERKPVSGAVADRWVDYLRQAFPDGRADPALVPPGVDLSTLTSDPADQHVCALALVANAQLLITFDDGFHREPLRELGVTVTKPDAVLAPAFDEQPGLVLGILERQAAAWGNRPLPELLDALDRADVPVLVSKARAALEE